MKSIRRRYTKVLAFDLHHLIEIGPSLRLPRTALLRSGDERERKRKKTDQYHLNLPWHIDGLSETGKEARSPDGHFPAHQWTFNLAASSALG